MGIIYVLLPLSVLLALGALGAFLWAAKSGQMDDTDTPARRIVDDE